ncbi:hypothetical protein [Rhodobacter aestuarii]|uniref:hypothetical protein n=1 Tax=Rhodobacter aestuarii TaxID=453582 RepID=UPI0011156958|nr:hypothetical protein [Rhodobacter aestuarii]
MAIGTAETPPASARPPREWVLDGRLVLRGFAAQCGGEQFGAHRVDGVARLGQFSDGPAEPIGARIWMASDGLGAWRARRLLLESILLYPGLLTEAQLIEVTA